MSIVPVVPSTSGRALTSEEYCAQAVPWNCKWYGFPGLTDLLASGGKRPCAEAWDLYDACVAGGFNRNIPSGSGAGKAPEKAAQPGLNYNDPTVLQSIYEEQLRNDKTKWDETIKAIMQTMSGDGSGDRPAGLNWIVLLALVIVVGGLMWAKK